MVRTLGGLKVYASEEVEKKFRKAAMMVFGYDRWSLSMPAEKAFRDWAENVEKALYVAQILGNPVEAMWGMLSHVEKSGVELKHEARGIRAKKTVHTYV